jgi:hypothetical protein
MNPPLFSFLFRCGVIVATTAVLTLAMMQVGSAGESPGACASLSDRYAQVSPLQAALRPVAMIAGICDS